VSTLWAYFWPCIAAGIIVGLVDGLIAFRRPGQRYILFVLGAVLSIGLAALWHGPMGAAMRFSSEVELTARAALVYNEIPEVSAHLHHGPLTRRIMLSGPADEFQRSELVRIMDEVPGVASAGWSTKGAGVPLLAEGAAASVAGFLLGLVLAYLVELRRRYNAEWKW